MEVVPLRSHSPRSSSVTGVVPHGSDPDGSAPARKLTRHGRWFPYEVFPSEWSAHRSGPLTGVTLDTAWFPSDDPPMRNDSSTGVAPHGGASESGTRPRGDHGR